MIADAAAMTKRNLLALLRQPLYIAITLFQPVVWILLFGSLFERVTQIPGFDTDSYAGYLTPGIVALTALFAGFRGMAMLEDIHRGTLDRFLASPVRRVALIIGPLAQSAINVLIQSLIIMAMGFALGARFAGGFVGVAVFLLGIVLLSSSLAAMSHALALLLREEESLVAAMNFLVLPMAFLSTAFMPAGLIPGWIANVARFNPLNWALEAGRGVLGAEQDWGAAAADLGLLAALAAAFVGLAMIAFRAYQRSA